MPHFTIVGLRDKAVAESRERVRGALNAIGLALPPKRITVASPQPTSRRKAATTTSPSRSG
jgi:predicted ATPase with chaperone activity